jgi:hypothetical protein
MRMQRIICLLAALAVFWLGGFGCGAVRADMIYEVTVDTSSLNGTNGYLDFQFNPGNASALAALATISNFTGGTPGSANSFPLAGNTGDASGSLPGTLTLDNGTAYNDSFQGFTYGSSFSFDLTLSGPALDNPSGNVGSSFALSLYAADGATPLLTTDPNNSVLTINLNADGTTTIETFLTPTGDPSVVTATAMNAAPEPSSLVLMATALPAGLLAWRRYRQAHPRPKQ